VAVLPRNEGWNVTSVWNLKGHIFFYYYYYYYYYYNKNCVHCVCVTAVYRTVEGGRKSMRFKCKLHTFILSVYMQWCQMWHKVNVATCILVVTLVTVALVLPHFIFIWIINIGILVILCRFVVFEYHVRSVWQIQIYHHACDRSYDFM
jgi:hypothetical protein